MLLFLVYHKVVPARSRSIYSLGVNEFLSHLNIIFDSGLKIRDPKSFSVSSAKVENGVVLSFDDGTADHYEHVLPILTKYSISGLFYVPTSKIDRLGYITSEQIIEMSKLGHTIGSHSHSHDRLDIQSPEFVRSDLGKSISCIGSLTGKPILHFAPPGGFHKGCVTQIASELGFSFIRTMHWGYNPVLDPLRIEALPMTQSLGQHFLTSALQGNSDFLLRMLFQAKNLVRSVTPSKLYSTARQKFLG